MADILSQNQIDELLNAMKEGDVSLSELDGKSSDKKVRPYDFEIPKKFNKEQLKTISIIYENYGRLLSSYLSGILRTYCQVQVITIEEQRYFEYSNALPENNMMGVLEMRPLEGSCLITVSQSLTFNIIDRLLGGQGGSYEVNREYTEIEFTLMENVIRDISRYLKEAWANVYAIEPAFIRLESNTRQTQLVSPNETVVIIVLNVKIKDYEGNISFCIPYMILEPIIEHLNTKYWFTERNSSDKEKHLYKAAITDKITTISMELRAVLGTSRLSLREIMELRPGDVIELDQYREGKTLVKSNDEDWFTGTLGVYKRHMAVRIDEVLRKGANNNGTEPKPRNQAE